MDSRILNYIPGLSDGVFLHSRTLALITIFSQYLRHMDIPWCRIQKKELHREGYTCSRSSSSAIRLFPVSVRGCRCMACEQIFIYHLLLLNYLPFLEISYKSLFHFQIVTQYYEIVYIPIYLSVYQTKLGSFYAAWFQ